MKANHIALLCSIVAFAGCSLTEDQRSSSTPNKSLRETTVSTAASPGKADALDDLPVICYLEKRDRVITVKAGPNGAVYCVKTKDGAVLLQNVSEEQLQAQAPELHEFIKTAMAGYAGKDGVIIDASVRTAPTR